MASFVMKKPSHGFFMKGRERPLGARPRVQSGYKGRGQGKDSFYFKIWTLWVDLNAIWIEQCLSDSAKVCRLYANLHCLHWWHSDILKHIRGTPEEFQGNSEEVEWSWPQVEYFKGITVLTQVQDVGIHSIWGRSLFKIRRFLRVWHIFCMFFQTSQLMREIESPKDLICWFWSMMESSSSLS